MDDPLNRGRAAAVGSTRTVLGLVDELQADPEDDSKLRKVAIAAFEQPDLFVTTVLDHFSIPTAEFADLKARIPQKPPCGTRKTWSNYVGTQVADPFEIACPQTIDELRAVLKRATANAFPVRAVGSHHAWSDAALTDGIAIETSALLGAVIRLEASLLRDPADAATLVTVPGGMTIATLNEELDDQGLALINMGGYDGQTLAGVISTSTHGSGLALGSFPSFVEGLVVIKADGKILQIERTNGVSHPGRFAAQRNGIELIQDDRFFNACVVGIGCLGIIYGVILRVRSKYLLSEVRAVQPWTQIRRLLQDGRVLRENRHVEVWINPHLRSGQNTCLLTLRNEVTNPASRTRPKRFRGMFGDFLAAVPGADRVLAWLFNTFPQLSPYLIDEALRRLEHEEPVVDVSYKMFNIGAANDFAALSSELGVDLPRHVNAMGAMLKVAAQAEAANTFHSGPIVLRYVAASPGFLSMQPRETCMIELPMLRDVFGADAMLWRYENLLTQEFEARPHWGQRNFLTGSREMLSQLYGEEQVRQWLEVFEWFNPAGEFRSRFTDRVGFSTHAPEP